MSTPNGNAIPLVQRVPEVFSQTNVDPKIRKRVRPMKLIVLGLPRTGTMSIRAALDRLGYRVHHMSCIMQNPRDAALWEEATRMKCAPGGPGKVTWTREQWDMVLGDYDACIDFPSTVFVPELMAAYPEAKVIISQRDAEKWWTSISSTIMKSATIGEVWPIWLDPSTRPIVKMLQSQNIAWGDVTSKEHMQKRYNGFYDEARKLAPEGRTLEWTLAEGWGPLCEFLEKEAPPKCEPFPHVNDAASWGAAKAQMRKRSLATLKETAIKWGAITVAAVLLYQRYGPSLQHAF